MADHHEIHFTVSLGVTEYCLDDNLDSLLERADRALYQAKQNGRNQVRTCALEARQVIDDCGLTFDLDV
jgi:diguanylate cyclase (GGDEF)-like protein